MKVQKGKNLVLFFDLFLCVCLIFLTSLGLFSGFDLTRKNFIIYLIIISGIIVLGCVFFIFYSLFYNIYYEFNDDGIYIIKRKAKKKLIEYNKIISAEYYRLYHLLFGNSSGGTLRILFKQGDKMMHKDIAISLKQVKNLPFHRILVK